MQSRESDQATRADLEAGGDPAASAAAATPARKRTRADPVAWTTARTLYNLIDARWPEHAASDPLPAIERAVRHAGPSRARSLWLATRWLDWEPVLRGPLRRRFWRLPRAERAAAAARWEHSRLARRRAAFAWLAAVVEGQSSGA